MPGSAGPPSPVAGVALLPAVAPRGRRVGAGAAWQLGGRSGGSGGRGGRRRRRRGIGWRALEGADCRLLPITRGRQKHVRA